MKKKLICTILILNLVLVPSYHCYADAGTISIAGGTIGVGGLAGGALAGLAGPAVVAVFVGMMAVGIDIELTKQSEQAGLTKTEFLKQKMDQYCTEAGKTTDVFYKGITNGTSVLRDGTIAFSDSTASQIKQFINWLFENNEISENVGTGENTININGIGYPYGTTYQFTGSSSGNVFGYTTSVNVAWMKLYYQNNKGCVAMVGNEAFTLTVTRNGSSYGNYNSVAYNGYYYQFITSLSESFTAPSAIDLPQVGTSQYDDTSNMRNFINSISSWDMSGAAGTDGFTGTRDEWNDKSGAFDPAQGYSTVVNPGLVGQIPIPADTDITVNVQDYLDALKDVLDKLQDRVIEGVDGVDGIPKDWEIPDTVAIDPTIGKHPPIPDSDRTPVSNDEPIDPSKTPTLATEPLKFDLRNIFPFCIPFDIKDMFSLLNAEPVAPRYTVNWDLPFLQENFTFTIDLTPWSDVAVILRKMELLTFVIGLALVTRNLIRG